MKDEKPSTDVVAALHLLARAKAEIQFTRIVVESAGRSSIEAIDAIDLAFDALAGCDTRDDPAD